MTEHDDIPTIDVLAASVGLTIEELEEGVAGLEAAGFLRRVPSAFGITRYIPALPGEEYGDE